MDEVRLVFGFVLVFGLLGTLYLFAGRSKHRASPSWTALKTRLFGFGKQISASQPEPIHVTRRLSLTANHQLHVVLLGDRKLLLCTFPQGCTLLSSTENIKHPLETTQLKVPDGFDAD